MVQRGPSLSSAQPDRHLQNELGANVFVHLQETRIGLIDGLPQPEQRPGLRVPSNECFVQTKYDYSLRSPPLLLEKVGLLRLAGDTDNKVQVICNLNLDARFVVQLDRTLNALGLVVNNCCASE